MSKHDYTIQPLIGLGSLRFNSASEDNFALQEVYGSFRSIDRTGDRSYWEEQIKKAKDLDQRKRYESILVAMKNFDYTLITYYYGNCIFACYKDNKLVEIGANDKSIDIYYKDINIFKDDPKNVVDRLIKELGEFPYIDDQQIYFKNAAITLSCFIEGVVEGEVLWAEEYSDAAEEKSMAFNMHIDISDEEFATYYRYKAGEI
ncbi:hypothetical protein [Bartonella sp. HY038]|uniref:hypothetical protein n=1 Tax=Bartonella sp. HY038 TaxID=2759660 RepID=UPI0015F7D86B|nr:hypothetical protein [Bartonella sp. HY038]